ncbi:MAG: hypothetical protein IEMM0002_1230 [bacterium]|nr:MAG: hypothetical protein IEMM0002_1230 [bacterium]
MARAWVIQKVSGAADWFVVKDDLGVQHNVQSAVAGFDYATGGQYRLFVPGGKYEPCRFRLLPYKTSKRWRDVADLAKTHPASGAGLYLWGGKKFGSGLHDEAMTVSETHEGHVHFVQGGCAAVPDENQELYQQGDCVAVIRDVVVKDNDGNNMICATASGGGQWVAGFACDQDPETLAYAISCSKFFEYWSNYLTPYADLINGGGAQPPAQNVSGIFIFNKTNPVTYEIRKWTAQASGVYVDEGHPYGQSATVWAGDRLLMESAAITREVDYLEGEALKAAYPRPIIMPPALGNYSPTTRAVISPPVIAKTSVGRRLDCKSKLLRMTLNLSTRDERNHYSDLDGLGTGLQLPACVVLIFSEPPYPDYLNGSTINPNLYTTGNPDYLPIYASVKECNLDKPFALVYSAPGMQDFSGLRTEYPGAGLPGQYALIRPLPRRDENGSYYAINGVTDILRYKFNAPMDDMENSFASAGLHTRCFDYYGGDISPAPDAFPSGGFFPGFFEIADQTNVTRNIYDDFMAAYPFMNNPLIKNSDGKLPTLTEALFYLQGKVYRDADSQWAANKTTLECQKFEFFYE